MMNLQILNTRDVKKITKKLEEQYGFTEDLEFAFLRNKKGKIYVVNRDLAKINYDKLRIDTVGMYFGTEDSAGNLRLSIEGSQIVGPHASKNVLEIKEGLFKLWIAGHDIPMKKENSDFLIIRHGDDYITCGKIIDNVLRNYVPKSRRITNLID